MIRFRPTFWLTTLAAIALAGCTLADRAPVKPKKILFFTKSSNFEHNVIKERNGHLSFAAQVLKALGPEHGIEFTFSKDGSLFTPEYLAQFDGFFFYTSGDLLAAGTDGNPPMTAAGKQALLDAIKGGKAFIGTHAAADTFHTGETVDTNTKGARTWRYRVLGDKADPYTQMIGGELIIHGIQQLGTVRVIDPKFPGFAKYAPSFEAQEEWYSMTNFAPDLHVLLVLDTATMRNPYPNEPKWPPQGWDTPYKRPPYPVAWTHRYGAGRVFYTAMGHSEETWRSPRFQELVFGGIDWALGRKKADLSPNLARVAPAATTLPPVSAPVAGLPPPLKSTEGQTPDHIFP
jgi:type 1 glutamine amidotransferase